MTQESLMKASFIESPGQIVLKDVPVPVAKESEVLIEVKASGICGTDMHIFRGEYLGSYPVTPGHEFAGRSRGSARRSTPSRSGTASRSSPTYPATIARHASQTGRTSARTGGGSGITLPGRHGRIRRGAREGGLRHRRPRLCVRRLRRASVLRAPRHAEAKPRAGRRHPHRRRGPHRHPPAQDRPVDGRRAIDVVDERAPSRLELARPRGSHRAFASIDDIPKERYDLVIDATGVPAVMGRTIDWARQGGRILLFGVPPGSAGSRWTPSRSSEGALHPRPPIRRCGIPSRPCGCSGAARSTCRPSSRTSCP